jgi:hypothetical protein
MTDYEYTCEKCDKRFKPPFNRPLKYAVCFGCRYAEAMAAAHGRFAPMVAALVASGLDEDRFSVWQTGGMTMCLAYALERDDEGRFLTYVMWSDPATELGGLVEALRWFGAYDDRELGADHWANVELGDPPEGLDALAELAARAVKRVATITPGALASQQTYIFDGQQFRRGWAGVLAETAMAAPADD